MTNTTAMERPHPSPLRLLPPKSSPRTSPFSRLSPRNFRKSITKSFSRRNNKSKGELVLSPCASPRSSSTRQNLLQKQQQEHSTTPRSSLTSGSRKLPLVAASLPGPVKFLTLPPSDDEVSEISEPTIIGEEVSDNKKNEEQKSRIQEAPWWCGATEIDANGNVAEKIIDASLLLLSPAILLAEGSLLSKGDDSQQKPLIERIQTEFSASQSSDPFSRIDSDPFSRIGDGDDTDGETATGKESLLSASVDDGEPSCSLISKALTSSEFPLLYDDSEVISLGSGSSSEGDFDQLLGGLRVVQNERDNKDVDSANPFVEVVQIEEMTCLKDSKYEMQVTLVVEKEEFVNENVKVVYCEMDETRSADPFFEIVHMEQQQRDEETLQDVSLSESSASLTSNSVIEDKPEKKDSCGIVGQQPDGECNGQQAACAVSEAPTAPSSLVALMETLRTQESELGEHEDIAAWYAKLGDFYFRKDEWEASLKFYYEALRIQRVALKETKTPEFAKILNSIGKIYFKLGDCPLAMDIHQKALELLDGTDRSHPVVLQTLICMGDIYYRMRNSLSTIQSSSNPQPYNDFLETRMLDSVAHAHTVRGTYRRAIAFLEEKMQLLNSRGTAMDSQKEAAATLTNLGMLSCKAGYYTEALDYQELAVNIEEKLGPPPLHMTEAGILKGTALVCLGDYEKARTNFQEALDMVQATVGKDNEAYVQSLRGVGTVETELFEYDAAMKRFEKALKIQRNLYNKENHAEILLTRLEIAKVLIKNFELEKAMALLSEVLQAQTNIYGKRHPDMAETLEKIGMIRALQGRLSEALDNYEQCFFMREKFLGIGHPLVATVLHNIANVHAIDGKHDKSLRILANVVLIRKETLGEDHIDVVRALTSKGNCLVALGKMKEAMTCFNDSLSLIKPIVGESHPTVADIHAGLGRLHLHKCEYDEAPVHLQQAVEIYRAFQYNEAHPSIVLARETLARVKNEEMLCV